MTFQKKYIVGGAAILVLIVVVVTSVWTVAGRKQGGSEEASSSVVSDEPSLQAAILPPGMPLPETWPEDVPTYPRAVVETTSVTPTADGKKLQAVILSSTDSTADISEYYNREIPSRGWTMGEYLQAGPAVIISATKQGRTASILIVTDEGKTSVTLEVEEMTK